MLLEAGAPASAAIAKVARKAGHESVATLVERWGGDSPAASGHGTGAKEPRGQPSAAPPASPAAASSSSSPPALGALLGRGIFSEVHALAADAAVAVKTAKPFDANGTTKQDLSRLRMVLREMRILGTLRGHVHVATLLGASVIEPRGKGQSLAVQLWCVSRLQRRDYEGTPSPVHRKL